ncbi:DUF1829 domain-containing protein [Bifidobacterium bifidum]|uniref:DUF1829 domain-containing protein n=1 Tax=Bifidobacterium bifidum TaxID=1681 RepID=UPI0002866073|nr:DUF1829 domain-containing protein [Bifidobacterium bifidum]EKE50964.1 hypothetical protein B216_03359 [Bifidobacterium bifidum LMG 13195]KLN76891.1 hypothetical protein LMG13195_1431 [Bifidobacterium bifidum LMG 13195]MDG5948597.1 DUF1829 domain-containing protein [Bifidobacterium bifidum]MDG5967103.1 DUF1829 domain-containing protein [Bifidobacterium bifidum]PVV32331.1 DUF1829 domain-containing protein [Bifidobacterium bifidum]
MNSIESIKPDELIEEYGEWLKHESSAKDLGEWKEITLPMFDHSNDDLIFYAKTAGDGIMFTDDGYTLESFRQNGVTITEARRERMERIARKYGAGIKNGEIVLESDGRRGDAMNRYAQALIGVGSMMEAAQRRVAEYFADDVATVLDGCNVFYTASVGIRGVSRYEHSFDFIFQRSANHPTRFCQAPNKFDKDAVRNIMWGWEDTRKAKERADAKLVVIGDDREGPLQDGAAEAFANCGVSVIPYSQLAKRAPQELAA